MSQVASLNMTSSRFAKHAFFWLILPIVLVLSAPALPELSLFEISGVERQSNIRMLGESAHVGVEERTERLFRHWFVDSGMINFTFRTFAPQQDAQAFQVAKDANESARYLTRVWTAVHKAIYRAMVALHWFIALGVILIACLIDGVCQRWIKNFEFGYSNPVAFHISGHGLLGVFGLLVATPFLPFEIQEWVWPMLMAAAGFMVWKAAESYQSAL